MGDQLKTHLDLLQAISLWDDEWCAAVLEMLKKDKVYFICEVVINLRYGTLDWTKEILKLLTTQKTVIERLTIKKTNTKREAYSN